MHTSGFLNATVENVNAFNKELFLLANAVFWGCFFVFVFLQLCLLLAAALRTVLCCNCIIN